MAKHGIVHLIPQQVFNATLLGLILGLIAIRTKSLIPAIVFHFANNTLAVLQGRWLDSSFLLRDYSVIEFFLFQQDGDVRFHWPLLSVCGILVFFMLRLLLQKCKRKTSKPCLVP